MTERSGRREQCAKGRTAGGRSKTWTQGGDLWVGVPAACGSWDSPHARRHPQVSSLTVSSQHDPNP